ncbi:hypothetical protein FB566_3351 [Stackebrandtia endophytica]|uniref:Uncharacterized protein n=1 Tax=Stackebrandtia endophytica TaxID=1496996 RepID=A0A543AYY2_9ACTN|nr:hypothetical protein [Stackebrandtia endophytica]TQL77784.1 hypothetical protein FB566_3351 [Stackebrandtia endophytica]
MTGPYRTGRASVPPPNPPVTPAIAHAHTTAGGRALWTVVPPTARVTTSPTVVLLRFVPLIAVLFAAAGVGIFFVLRDPRLSTPAAIGLVTLSSLLPVAMTAVAIGVIRRVRPRPAWTVEYLYPDRIVAHDGNGGAGLLPLHATGIRVIRHTDRVDVLHPSWVRGANPAQLIFSGRVETLRTELRGDRPGPGIVLAATTATTTGHRETVVKPQEDLMAIVAVLRRSPHREAHAAADRINALAAEHYPSRNR